jgi:hypothetical protein
MGRWFPDEKDAAPMDEKIHQLILSSNVFIIYDLYDCHLPYVAGILKHITTLVYINTEKNTVYYTCSPSLFPNVKNIIMINSHPCEYTVLYRFKDVVWTTNHLYRYYSDLKPEFLKEDEENKISSSYYNPQSNQIFYSEEWMPVEKYSSIQKQFWAGVLYLQKEKKRHTILEEEEKKIKQ